jgi:molybdopterin converting factor small subunit
VICDSVTLKARLETAVKAGDRLTLMPMISGG